jgi:hypothetical protein
MSAMNPERAAFIDSSVNSTMSKPATTRYFVAPDYDKKIDFFELARQDAEFANVVRGSGGQVRWNNPEHVR